METTEEDFKLSLCTKQSMSRALEEVRRQWQDFEKRFDSTAEAVGKRSKLVGGREKAVEEMAAQVAGKERKLEMKAKEFEREVLLREEKLKSLEMRIEERTKECKETEDRLASARDSLASCIRETERKEDELISVRESVEECRRVLEMKRRDLDDLQRRMEECSIACREKEACLESTMNALAKRVEETEAETKELIAVRMRKLHKLQRSIETKSYEEKLQDDKLGMLEKRVEELSGQRRDMEDNLALARDSLAKCLLERRVQENEQKSQEMKLNSVQELLHECSSAFDEKKRMLQSTEDLLQNSLKDLMFTKDELELVQLEISNCRNELSSKSEEFSLIQNSIKACDKALEMKKAELLSLHDSFKATCSELDSRKTELEKVRKLIDGCTSELHLKERELSLIREEHESREKDYDVMKTSLEACSAEVNSKKEELVSLERSIKDLEDKVVSLQNSSQQFTEDIELKKAELASTQNNIEEVRGNLELQKNQSRLLNDCVKVQTAELEQRKKEFHSVSALLFQRAGELKLTEQKLLSSQSELAVASFGKRSRDLEERERKLSDQLKVFNSQHERLHLVQMAQKEKERQLEEQLMAFKSQKELLNSMQRALQDNMAEFGSRVGVDQLDPLVKYETFENPLASIWSMDDSANLQLFICEYLEKHDLVHQKLGYTIQMSLDPAELVLGVMQQIDPLSSRKLDRRFDSNIVKRSCVMLLSCLADTSPTIKPEVKEAALVLAIQWKFQLRYSPSNYPFAAMAFLKLVGVYELTSSFCANELESLVNYVPDHNKKAELQQLLGLSRHQPSPMVIHPGQAEQMLARTSPGFSGPQMHHTNKRSRQES